MAAKMSKQQLAESLDNFNLKQLVEVYNKVKPKSARTRKAFSNKRNALAEIREMLGEPEAKRAAKAHKPKETKRRRSSATAKPKVPQGAKIEDRPPKSRSMRRSGPKVEPKPTAELPPHKSMRRNRGTNLKPPGHPPKACRAGTKQSILVDKLSRKRGASMDELLEALSGGRKPWQPQTVRFGFGWDLKLKGYGVRSEFDKNGVERFVLVLPKGHAKPPAHY